MTRSDIDAIDALAIYPKDDERFSIALKGAWPALRDLALQVCEPPEATGDLTPERLALLREAHLHFSGPEMVAVIDLARVHFGARRSWMEEAAKICDAAGCKECAADIRVAKLKNP
jgi:hypothetical protein